MQIGRADRNGRSGSDSGTDSTTGRSGTTGRRPVTGTHDIQRVIAERKVEIEVVDSATERPSPRILMSSGNCALLLQTTSVTRGTPVGVGTLCGRLGRGTRRQGSAGRGQIRQSSERVGAATMLIGATGPRGLQRAQILTMIGQTHANRTSGAAIAAVARGPVGTRF